METVEVYEYQKKKSLSMLLGEMVNWMHLNGEVVEGREKSQKGPQPPSWEGES